MTPEQQSAATRLETDYRALERELSAWKSRVEPELPVDPVTHTITSVAGVPTDAWHTYRLACIAHVQNAIDANRRAMEKL